MPGVMLEIAELPTSHGDTSLSPTFVIKAHCPRVTRGLLFQGSGDTVKSRTSMGGGVIRLSTIMRSIY